MAIGVLNPSRIFECKQHLFQNLKWLLQRVLLNWKMRNWKDSNRASVLAHQTR